MKRWIAGLVCTFVLGCAAAAAQDIAGNWQGTSINETGKESRFVLRIFRADTGDLDAVVYSLDHDHAVIPAHDISLRDSTLKFSVMDDSYEGKLSADGASIVGTLSQGNPRPLNLNFRRAAKETTWVIDSPPYKVQFITVDPGVKLEVLDWGGTGRPLVFLAGLGDTAHAFEKFAPKLTGNYHVYGITRRGFGASSAPVPANGNYSADHLGDDVLAVIAALKLDRPVLIGHSIAGEELSSIGSRYPEKVAGLIYLEAGYDYAYYDRSQDDLTIDTNDLQHKLDQLSFDRIAEQKSLVPELLQTDLPQLEKDLQRREKLLQAMPEDSSSPEPITPHLQILEAIHRGEQKYTEIKCPVLAIFAQRNDPDGPTAAEAFQAGVPSAHVVQLPNANHYIFDSNEADVLREMNSFLLKLP